MDFTPIIDGFGIVLQPTNLLYCLVGVLIGMLIGVLPGLRPAAQIPSPVALHPSRSAPSHPQA